MPPIGHNPAAQGWGHRGHASDYVVSPGPDDFAPVTGEMDVWTAIIFFIFFFILLVCIIYLILVLCMLCCVAVSEPPRHRRRYTARYVTLPLASP